MQSKLILLEGNPFTGKSTLSEYAAHQLALNGHAVEWVCEGAMFEQHFPQVLAMADQEQPFADDVFWAEWSAFAQTVESSPAIFVVDAAVSYAALYTLLVEDHPLDSIEAAVRQLGEMLAPLHPRAIYLRGDQEQLARASIADRGAKWEKQMIDQSDAAPYQQARGRSGLEAAITLLQEVQDLMDALLEKGGWPTLTLDVTSTDRDTNRRAVLDFLGISEVVVPAVALAEPLPAYAGTYDPDDPETPMGSIEVRIEQDQLVFHTKSGERISPFVPVSPTRLHLRANPIDVEFEVEDGQAQRFVLLWTSGKTRPYHRA